MGYQLKALCSMNIWIRTQLVLASSLTALLTTVIITSLAIKNVINQCDLPSNASKKFMQNQPSAAPEALQVFNVQYWQSIFIIQAAFVVFVIAEVKETFHKFHDSANLHSNMDSISLAITELETTFSEISSSFYLKEMLVDVY